MFTLSFVDINGEGNDYTIGVSDSVDKLKEYVETEFDEEFHTDLEWKQVNNATIHAVLGEGYHKGDTIYVIEEVDVI